MRPQLLGYLLDALEPAEREALEQQVSRDPALTAELETMRDALDPLLDDDEPIQAPVGLAQRTCHFVAARSQIERDTGRQTGSSQWTMQDIGVAAGIFVAASMLFFPAVMTSRSNARMAQCEHNLATISGALGQYSDHFGGQYPSLEPEGKTGVAGVCAFILFNSGYLERSTALVCPSSQLAENITSFRVPTLDDVSRAGGKQLIVYRKNMGGSYAFPLGYFLGDVFVSPRTGNGPTFPVVADAPGRSGTASNRHGRQGQNVLFEAGNVKFNKSPSLLKPSGRQDHIFRNDRGIPAAGVNPDDAVLGSSATPPIPPVLKDVGSER